MTYREADGGDKVAAFARGASDEEMHLAFESPGVTAYVVEETYLVAYRVHGPTLTCVVRRGLYGNGASESTIDDFLREEAEALGCTFIAPWLS